jgi:hypothetical protein
MTDFCNFTSHYYVSIGNLFTIRKKLQIFEEKFAYLTIIYTLLLEIKGYFRLLELATAAIQKIVKGQLCRYIQKQYH